MVNLKYFNFWCQSVLPLVYDQSLSYYEVLCKVVDYINKLIESDNQIIENVEQLKQEMTVVEKWIKDFDTSYFEKLLKEYVPVMVMFGLSDNGYFMAYIPDSWNDVYFKTTGYDTYVEMMPEYGHLILEY